MSNSINASIDLSGRHRVVDATATGERIRNYRRRIHLKATKLAEVLGVSDQTVSKWENGRSAPSLDSLGDLTYVFNVTLDDLVVYKLSSDSDDDDQVVSFFALFQTIIEIQKRTLEIFKKTPV